MLQVGGGKGERRGVGQGYAVAVAVAVEGSRLPSLVVTDPSYVREIIMRMTALRFVGGALACAGDG